MPSFTIVHVGGFPTGMKMAPHHSVEIKLSNGLVRLGHLVLNFSDRDVARAKSWTGSRKLGRGAVNAALIEFCRSHRPDILLLGHADMIDAATVAAIRDEIKDLRVGQWNVDPLFEPDNLARIRKKLGVVDASFISTAGAPLAVLREGGSHGISFMPNPADISIERGRADLIRDPAFDLFYACRNPAHPLRIVCGRPWDMNEFVASMRRAAPQLRIKCCGIDGAPLLVSAQYQSALESSASGLNISRRADHYLYSSDRIAQLAGNGCVVAIERSVGYGDYFAEDEMVFFSGFEELTEKLARLAAEPETRMRMGAAGRARYLKKFNERAVAAHLLAVLCGSRAPEAMPW
jgi:glycosyltransferase involved in cell wall biosynthesis